MKKRKVTLRIAVPDDAGALMAIYAPYVLNTAVTYEYEVPSAGEFRRRIVHTLENYPYVVAEVDGEIAGYAYTGRLGVRAAFAWAAETSIYIREDMHGLGIGRKLYDALEKFSQVQHIVTLHSGIPGSWLQVHRRHCSGSLFLHGSGSHCAALRHPPCHYKKRTLHSHGLQSQIRFQNHKDCLSHRRNHDRGTCCPSVCCAGRLPYVRKSDP